MAADPCATAAHRGRLCTVLAQALPGMEARFIAAERDGKLAGGAPVVIERRAGFHWIHALPFLLPGAPVALEGMRRATLLTVELRARGVSATDLATELGTSSLRNPFNGNAFAWNAAEQAVEYLGPDPHPWQGGLYVY